MPKTNKKKVEVPATRPKKKKEIQQEYLALEAIQKRVPHFEHTGEDNWEMIGAQIQTLKWEYTLDQIDHWWPDKTGRDDGNNHGAAEDALFWKQGGDIPSPSSIWSLQVGKRQKGPPFDEKYMEKPREIRDQLA